MSLPNTISSGQTISASPVQANFSDIASELTGSLPRNGEAAMTGQFKSSSGTAALPGLTFSADTDSGFFRKSSNVIGVSAGGVEVATIDSTGFVYFPSGTVMLFMQTTAPTGWTKDTTHNDKALRIVSGTASSGGSTAFTSVFAARTITQANLPAVNLSSANLNASSSTSITILGGTIGATGTSSWGSDGGGINGLTNASSIGTSATTTTSISGTVPLGGSGTAVDFAVQYVDVISASKD